MPIKLNGASKIIACLGGLIVIAGAVVKIITNENKQDFAIGAQGKAQASLEFKVDCIEKTLGIVNYKLDRAFLIDSLQKPNIAYRADSIQKGRDSIH